MEARRRDPILPLDGLGIAKKKLPSSLHLAKSDGILIPLPQYCWCGWVESWSSIPTCLRQQWCWYPPIMAEPPPGSTTSMNLQEIMLGVKKKKKKPIPKHHPLCDSIYTIFLKWQNFRNGEEISRRPGIGKRAERVRSSCGYQRAWLFQCQCLGWDTLLCSARRYHWKKMGKTSLKSL